jgi:peptidyl-prolyl cis-trans isomerase B (cyclophilin B)
MYRKKLLKLSVIASLCALSIVGCGKKETNNVEDNNSSVTVAPTEEVQREEPSLSKEAKKLTQFAELEKGDLIAEIVVKDFGTMKLKLFPEQAPKAVENFVTHAKDGYYNNLTFHRILEEFMIQGGDPEGTGAGGESIWGAPFEDEFSDDLYPFRGALCMANSGSNTNGSQFFVVQADEGEVKHLSDLILEKYKLSLIDYVQQAYSTKITQEELDSFLTYGGTPWLTKHHTVFGQLVEGFDVLDAIAATELADPSGVPITPVVIESVQITEYQGE